MIGSRLTTTAFMSLTDWENGGAETAGITYLTRTVTLTHQDSVPILQVEKVVSDEWLIEILLQAQLLGSGDIRIDGEVRLYEGSDVFLAAPQSETLFTLLAPHNRRTARTLAIPNGETNEAFATITVSFVNRQEAASGISTPAIQRYLAIAACSYIMDGTTFTPDSTTLLLTDRAVTVTSAQHTEVLSLEGSKSDKLWLRFQATAIVLTTGGIRVEGDAKLFLVSSEMSYKLVGQQRVTTFVPREQSVARLVTVRSEQTNANQKGGDFAAIALNFRNEALSQNADQP
ncbi:MAG: hypothetical protein KF832_27925 [Caldilineaceae bacterium]|nr:hypothetical protein [Caldilineaceae bacterium]